MGFVFDFGVFWQFYTDPILLEFGAGVLVYHYVFADRQEHKSPVVPGLLLIGGVILILAQPEFADDHHRFFSMGLPAIFIVIGGILALNFNAGWLKRLGDWSYSTYLVHSFVIHLSIVGLGMLGDINPLALTLVALSATVIASGLIYHLFELPVIRELRWVCNIYYQPREMRVAGSSR